MVRKFETCVEESSSKLHFVQIMIPKRTVRTRLVIKFLHSHNGGGLFRMVTVSLFFILEEKHPDGYLFLNSTFWSYGYFIVYEFGIFKLYEDLKTSNYMYYIILYWTLYLKQSILYYVPALHKAKILLLIKNDIFTVCIRVQFLLYRHKTVWMLP